MDMVFFSVISDIVIMILLAATIAYAVRLTRYLKKFKESRDDLQAIIKDLSIHISKADDAVKDLRQAVTESSSDLQRRMDRAMKMYDELEIIVQTGDVLASRLEDMAVRNRRIVEGGESDLANLARHARKDDQAYDTRLENIVRKAGKATDNTELYQQPNRPSFSIRDPEMERGEVIDDSGFTLEDNEVLSEAERDLYNALQKSKASRSGGAG